MATTEYDFTLTRQEIIEAAFKKMGILPSGDVLTAEMSADGVKALNLLMTQWSTEGLHFWSVTAGIEQTLSAGTSTYTLTNDPFVIGIDSGWIVESTSTEPVEIISMQKYESIDDKADPGKPIYCFVQNKANSTVVKFYPVPEKTYTFRYIGITKLKDWDNSNDKNLIPDRFLMALIYGLASYLSEDYKLPLAEQASIKNEYQFYFRKAKQSDKNQDDRPFVRGAYD